MISESSCGSKEDRQFPKYYLVAIPEGEIADRAKALQKELSTLYGIYREPYPPLHITVGVITFPARELYSIQTKLQNTVIPYLPLKLSTLGESCFPDPHKSINLSIERTGELVELSSKVIALVNEAGFSADSFENWDYHISLVNCNYATREWTEEEYEEACRRLRRERLVLTGAARRLELWDPAFPPLKVLATFGPESKNCN